MNKFWGRARFCVPFCIVNLILMFVVTLNVRAESLINRPPMDTNQRVNIYVDLNDESESRFLGIDVYKIAEIVDDEFRYIYPYSELGLTEFKRLGRDGDKYLVSQEIMDFIETNNVTATNHFNCFKGTGEIRNLETGVYILVQNGDDKNASLNSIMLVEAPKWDRESEEYLYDIHVQPRWERVTWFSFRPEVIYPLLQVVSLMICLALCLFGPRIIRGAFTCVVAITGGILGMETGRHFESSFIAMMIFFLLFSFVALGMLSFISMVVRDMFNKELIYKFLQQKQFWIVPCVGAALFAVFTYLWFIPQIYLAAAIFVILSVLGTYLQYLKKDEQIIFYTYDDLIKLEADDEDAKGE